MAQRGILFVSWTFVYYYSLDERGEPLYEGKRLAAVAIGDDAAEGVDGALVEAEVGPGDEPAELDEDPGRLEAQDTEYV